MSQIDSLDACKLLYSQAIASESDGILLRSRLSAIARRMHFPDIKRENMLLVMAEMASNQFKHAGGHGIVQLWQQPGPVLDLVALDYGPGIADLAQAEADGYSSANTLGKGLGSIRRLSDQACIYTRPESRGAARKWNGTLVMARFWLNGKPGGRPDEPPQPEIGLFSQSLSGSRYNGDRIYLQREGSRLRWLHLDGIGHGEEAEKAASCIDCNLFRSDGLASTLTLVDRQLVGSRGAVAVLGELDAARRSLHLLGVGDIHGHFSREAETMEGVSFAPGILGREHKTPSEFRSACGKNCIVVTASDGVRRNWAESSFPGLFLQHPQLIAYALGNVMGRLSDDRSVCVIKTASQPCFRRGEGP